MSSKSEPAGIFVRVSTGGQDEEQQAPEVEHHCAEHGYTIARRYELNDKSASKGEQQAKLDEMLADMREGIISVCVVWRSNRLERRGPEALFKLLRQVKDAGGRIESTTEPLLGVQDMSGEVLTAIGAIVDSQLPAKISEDVNRKLRQIKANGFIYNGNVPWGFVIVGEKYNKRIEPTGECRRYVPQIFDRCIQGDSLRTIAAWLDSEGVKPTRGTKWNEGSVRWIIRNRVYAGTLLNGEGTTVFELPKSDQVIRSSIFDRANEALTNHPKRGPSQNPPMLAKLRCARCAAKGIDSPMFRIKAGKRQVLKYRCYGRGPQRQGCGNLIPLELLEKMVVAYMIDWNAEPHQTKQWVEGQNWDDEISDVNQQIQEIMRDLLAEDAMERLAEKRADLVHYTELNKNREKGEYKRKDVFNDDGSVKTKGQHFYELDDEGRREYLKEFDIRAEKTADPKGVRLYIGGLTPVWQEWRED